MDHPTRFTSQYAHRHFITVVSAPIFPSGEATLYAPLEDLFQGENSRRPKTIAMTSGNIQPREDTHMKTICGSKELWDFLLPIADSGTFHKVFSYGSFNENNNDRGQKHLWDDEGIIDRLNCSFPSR